MEAMKWYARCGGIRKQGPFATQIDAVNSIRQVPESEREYASAMLYGEEPRARRMEEFPTDTFVWPEED
jgi:hypothetical protein